MTSVEPMTNNNDYTEFKNSLLTLFCGSPADITSNAEFELDELLKRHHKQYISLSSLKKFIEENEKENELDIKRSSMSEFMFNEGHNSALKLLDKFIHE